METLVANIKDDVIRAVDESLKKYDGQNVTIFVSDDNSELLKFQLDSLRTQSKSKWGEDAQSYIDSVRGEERVF